MTRAIFETSIVGKLPQVRGRYTENADLSRTTWFRVGGPAEVLFKPADLDDLSFFLKERPDHVPVTMMGVGSNLLVRDLGVPGVVIRLGRGFTNLVLQGDRVDVGAAVLDRTVALLGKDEGLEGLEFLCGVPGTIGGALRMNAGCYGAEMKDILEVAFALDPRGNLKRLTPEDLGYSYRHCGLPFDWIFVGARLKARFGDKKAIEDRIHTLLTEREESQPIRTRTGGSTFANPKGRKAWELIDAAGCRGLTRGDAMVSEKHCNFLVNKGSARAEDLEALAEEVRRRVLDASGVDLRWEIQRIGLKTDEMKAEGFAA